MRNRCEKYRKNFTAMCTKNIQQSSSVPQSLKLLLEIFGALSTVPRNTQLIDTATNH